MGSLLTTGDGFEIIGIPSGSVQLDFVAGTVTLPDGSVSNMNTNLNALGLSQCNSLGVWVSDADAQIFVGSALSLADHQLSHVVNQYGFSNVRIEIPANSTPDDTNQIFFVASTDQWMGYGFPRISHQRSQLPIAPATLTSTTAQTTILSKHVGAYNQFLITVQNTGGANQIDLVIEFSENNVDWFPDQGYTTAVTIPVAGATGFNAFASEVEHHFYRVRVNSTVGGAHSTFAVFWNFVNDRGGAYL